jgi:hypothetical protein
MPERWVPKFLEALAASPNVTEACRLAGVKRRTAYALKERNAEFAAAWEDALEQSTDDLVGEAWRRARVGTDKPVFYQGDECGRIREYSDTLTIFLLKAHRPHVYGDKNKLEVSGPGGGPLQLELLSSALSKVYGTPDGGA